MESTRPTVAGAAVPSLSGLLKELKLADKAKQTAAFGHKVSTTDGLELPTISTNSHCWSGSANGKISFVKQESKRFEFKPVRPWKTPLEGDLKRALSDLLGLTFSGPIIETRNSLVEKYSDSNGKLFVVKTLKKVTHKVSATLEKGEVLSMGFNQHPCLVEHYAALLQNKSSNFYCAINNKDQIPDDEKDQYTVSAIVSELIDGGDLVDATAGDPGRGVEPFYSGTELELTLLAGKAASEAIDYLHSQNISHRDIKHDNIMITRQTPHVLKLIDYGFCKGLQDKERTYTNCGTKQYLSPEQVMNLRSKTGFDSKVDCWQTGTLMLFLFLQCLPKDLSVEAPAVENDVHKGYENLIEYAKWSDQKKDRYFKKHFKDKYQQCEALIKLIIELHRHDPNERPTAAEVLRKLAAINVQS